jgi:catechol 2,3-dioxygenase-like lactoylglutathione lyase family enzyme
MTDIPFAMRGLDHVVIRCRDLPRMLAFYRDVLGCPVERVVESIRLTQLRAGSALIDLVDASSAPPEGRNMDHFCLTVRPFDADAILAHLAANGFAAEPPKRRYGAEGYGPSIYLADPEGNTVELKGPPEA